MRSKGWVTHSHAFLAQKYYTESWYRFALVGNEWLQNANSCYNIIIDYVTPPCSTLSARGMNMGIYPVYVTKACNHNKRLSSQIILSLVPSPYFHSNFRNWVEDGTEIGTGYKARLPYHKIALQGWASVSDFKVSIWLYMGCPFIKEHTMWGLVYKWTSYCAEECMCVHFQLLHNKCLQRTSTVVN